MSTRINEPEQVRPQRFDSRSPFPSTLPYQLFYRERVPLLFAFEAAISNCLFRESGRLAPKLGGHIVTPRSKATYYAAECGVYQGKGLAACAELALASGLDIRIFGLDSFSGLPRLGKMDRDLAPANAAYLSKPIFADTSVADVQKDLADRGVQGLVTLVPGLFADTLPALPDVQYFFVNIDCDLYEPHLECLRYFYPRLMRGGILFFDDYHSVEFPMARSAIDGFLAEENEQLLHLRFGDEGPNMTKAFIIKA